MADILTKICAHKRLEIEQRSKQRPLQQLKEELCDLQDRPRGFARALAERRANGKIGLIAEIKKASPSRGLIRNDFYPAQLADEYFQGGAACLSILTDEHFFQGTDSYLAEARNACTLPVLRKDFMLNPYQIYESRLLGADCVLLILAALEDAAARELESLALELRMDVLIETHNQAEMDRALTMQSPLIGVNNRNLKTFEIDLNLSECLLPQVPVDKIPIAESGFYRHEDLQRLKPFGVSTFLIGESLMREPDVTQATRLLLGEVA